MPSDKLTTDLRFGMVPRWIARHPDLTAHAVRVYAVLADHADKEGRSFPRRRTLAKECGGMSEKTVDRALALLLKHQALSTEHRPGHSTLFTVHRAPPEGISSRVSISEGANIDTGDAPNVDTGDTQKKTQIEEEKPRVLHSKESRDALWDEFVRLFGVPIAGETSRFGIAQKAALKAGITPDQLEPAMRRYRKAWEGVPCNPQALVNNWRTFGPDAKATTEGVPPEARSIYEANRKAQ